VPGSANKRPLGRSSPTASWNAKTALAALPIALGRGAQRPTVTSATIADMLKEGLDAEQAFCRQQGGRCEGRRWPARRKVVEAVYSYPYQAHATMEPMNANRALYAGEVRGLVPDAERASSTLACGRRSCGAAGREVRGLQTNARRAASGRRGFSDLCAPGGADSDADCRGTPVKLLWSR